jgi:post-segregation antitoxin (ccd killing protein)
VEALAQADLGVSINIAAPMDAAHRCCKEAGLPRHSVEYSLGFRGRVEKLPEARTLELSTMCGHGMVSAAFARKMVDWVKENRRTPAEAAAYLARFCSCGVFNTKRAERLLDEARSGATGAEKPKRG